MHHLKVLLFLAAMVSLLFRPLASEAAQVRLFAAASMNNAIKELISVFRVANPDIEVIPNFGPSGGLAKQIEQGAPADIYISANRKWMTHLQDSSLIVPESSRIFAYNTLVFVGHSGDAASLADLTKLKRIGIGSPKSVPAGQYAAQALAAAGIYDQLQQRSALVMAKDVRQALIYADRGETDGSFVYATDAMLATSAKVLFTVDPKLHDQIVYPIGLTTEGAGNTAARRFFDFVTSPEAAPLIASHGFQTAGQQAGR